VATRQQAQDGITSARAGDTDGCARRESPVGTTAGGATPGRRRASFLDRHTTAILVVMFAIGAASIAWYEARSSALLLETASLQAASLHSATLRAFRTLYTSEVVERVRLFGIEATHAYAETLGAIPLPVTLTIELGEALQRDENGLQVRLYSDYPFPWRRPGGPEDAFERDALAFLRREPEGEFVRFEDYRGRPSVRYATADLMRPYCVKCHNTHPDSPRRDWRVGDVRGVLEVIRPLDPVVAQVRANQRKNLSILLLLGAVGLSSLGLMTGRLRRTAQVLEDRVHERTAALQKANDDLNHEAAERERADAALRVQAAELQRSNAELQRFAYVASHDLRESLRMVSSFTQLLAERYAGKLDADADEFIGFAVGGARRMQLLLDGLLEYSRVGTRGRPFAPTSCEQVLDDVSANLRVTIEESGAVITRDPLPVVAVDRVQWVQLFQNLIANAIKYRSAEPPRIHISAQRRGGEWILAVRDNGIGIAPEHFERIFQMFQRLHTEKEYPGTGIGLAIAKKIVERHGGKIWVESRPGAGSTFFVAIPQRQEGAS
jgi:signal transduction histidine kinase